MNHPDNAVLVLLGQLHADANPSRVAVMEDIDRLIVMASKFKDRDWEKSKVCWIDAVAEHYNKTRDDRWNWKAVEMSSQNA